MRTSRGGRFARPGYVLILALGFTAIAVALGYAFGSMTAPAAPVASNLLAAAQARALAASGIDIAAHYLTYPPATVAACSYWTGTGAGSISIDGSSNGVTISVTNPGTDPRIFTVASRGTVVDSKGVTRGVRTVVADLVAPPPHRWCVTHAGMLGSTGVTNLPNMLKFYGDVHSNGSIVSTAWCKNAVTAVAGITWPMILFYGPPSSIQTLQPSKLVPSVPTITSTYVVNGVTCTAASWTTQNLDKGDWPCKGGVVTATNPGGLLVSTNGAAGSRVLRVKNDVQFTGTLVVDGDLELDGSGAVVQAVAGYPALIVTRDLVIHSSGSDLQVDGPVLIGGVLRKGGKLCNLYFNAPVIAYSSVQAGTAGSNCEVKPVAGGAVFHNLSGTADRQPYTILRWVEN